MSQSAGKVARYWFYQDTPSDIERGPCTPPQLKELAKNQIITKVSWVRRSDWTRAKRARDVPGLFPTTPQSRVLSPVEAREKKKADSASNSFNPLVNQNPFREGAHALPSISFTCASCTRKYKVAGHLEGRTFKCKTCSAPLQVPGHPETLLSESDFEPEASYPAYGDGAWSTTTSDFVSKPLKIKESKRDSWGELYGRGDTSWKPLNSDSASLAELKRKDARHSLVFGFLGLLLLGFGKGGVSIWGDPGNVALWGWTYICGTVVFISGACFAARSKGLRTAMGLWGLVAVIGWIVLLAHKSRPYTARPRPTLFRVATGFAIASVLLGLVAIAQSDESGNSGRRRSSGVNDSTYSSGGSPGLGGSPSYLGPSGVLDDLLEAIEDNSVYQAQRCLVSEEQHLAQTFLTETRRGVLYWDTREPRYFERINGNVAIVTVYEGHQSSEWICIREYGSWKVSLIKTGQRN